MPEQPDPFPRFTQPGALFAGHTERGAVLDAGLAHPDRQAGLGDPEVLRDLGELLAGLAVPGHADDDFAELSGVGGGRITYFPAAPHDATERFSSIRASVPGDRKTMLRGSHAALGSRRSRTLNAAIFMSVRQVKMVSWSHIAAAVTSSALPMLSR
jgi:hypothetical protein